MINLISPILVAPPFDFSEEESIAGTSGATTGTPERVNWTPYVPTYSRVVNDVDGDMASRIRAPQTRATGTVQQVVRGSAGSVAPGQASSATGMVVYASRIAVVAPEVSADGFTVQASRTRIGAPTTEHVGKIQKHIDRMEEAVLLMMLLG